MSGFGPYRIVGELGRGGMGHVLEASHPEMPGRRLALKLIPITTSEHTRQRFAREAELLGRIRHPGVVAVHASGHAPEGPWLVMDLIEGTSLHATLRERGAMSWERAGEISLGVAEAVAAMHAAGLIHRDLKPGNVMLRPDGTPILVDFGLAWADDVAPLTRTAAVLGTPAWLAPEIFRPELTTRHDPRIDVWGLGSILYALLVGHAPFERAQDVKRILQEDPPWPAAPGPLLRVLKRSLAKEPIERQADARAFADELRVALRASTRKPTRVGTLVAIGAALVAVTAVATSPERLVAAKRPTPAPVATASEPLPPVPTPAAPPRWQRLEHPGQPESVAAAFLPDGSGRFLSWAIAGPAARASELVEWRAGPGGVARTGRSWELAQEVTHLAFAGTRLYLLVGRALFLLDLNGAAPPLRLDFPPFDEPVTTLAVQADGSRCALAFVGKQERARVVVLRIEDGALRPEAEHVVDGMAVLAILLEPAGLTLGVNGPVKLNGLVLFPSEGASSRVPLTTGPTFVTRDPRGGLWLGTDGGFLHRCDPGTDQVEPQLQGVAAHSDFDQSGGLLRAPSHSGYAVALRFAGGRAFSASSDVGTGVRELRAWEERAGEWINVGGLTRFTSPLWSLDASPDGEWLIVGHGSALEVWARDAIPALPPDTQRLPRWDEVVAPLRRR